MTRDFFDPTPEQQNVVLIDPGTLQKTQRMIAGCEACSEDAEIPVGNILDRLTGSDPSVTAYVLELPTRCLQRGGSYYRKDSSGMVVGCSTLGVKSRVRPERLLTADVYGH